MSTDWSADLNAIRDKVAESKLEEMGRKERYVTRRANVLANNIFKFLNAHRKEVLELLEESTGEITSEQIIEYVESRGKSITYVTLQDISQLEKTEWSYDVAIEAGRILSQLVSMDCVVHTQYDYKLERRENADYMWFTLQIK